MSEKVEKGILEFLTKKQYAGVDDIATYFSISGATVRRKLTLLEEKGLIERTRGGAKINDTNNFYPSFSFRTHQNSLEKKKIALAGIKLIKNGDLVFIDGSTSCFFIADYLSEFNNIKVVTNGIDTLSLLSKNKINAYSTGGEVSEANRSCLVGQIAHDTINNMHADVVFFSAQSVGANGEIYDCFEHENYLRRQMMKNANKKVFLCDGTKLNRSSPFKLCNMDDIDYIICNESIKGYFEKDYSDKIICIE
ncbi:MAG: DeoR/GlpR transcriptional regulator [Clostridia bacterium]|nr:DeoR/GlpR transcriptional regulator [Clostridia bacterium]